MHDLHHTVCKHLDLIQMQLQPDMIAIDRSNETHLTLQSNDRQQDVTRDTNAESLMKYLETAPSKGNSIKASVEESVYKVMNLVQDCNDSDILRTVKAHMLSAILLMEAITVSRQSLEFSPTIKEAPNTNNLKQELFSTKNCPTKRKRMAKPTEEEKDMIKSQMAKESAKDGAVSWEEDDCHDNDEPVNWVKSDSCEVWIHIQCINNYDMNSSVYCNRCCSNLFIFDYVVISYYSCCYIYFLPIITLQTKIYLATRILFAIVNYMHLLQISNHCVC